MLVPVIAYVAGLLMLALITLFSGVMLEPILEIVAADPAVQDQGWAHTAESITDTINRNAPLALIGYHLVFGLAWALRRERVTSRRV